MQVLLNSTLAAWEIVPCDLLLYPDGDGAFKAYEIDVDVGLGPVTKNALRLSASATC